MNASELLAQLNALIAKHGDLPIAKFLYREWDQESEFAGFAFDSRNNKFEPSPTPFSAE